MYALATGPGLLRRKASAEHGRILEIHLTAAGRRQLGEALTAATQLENELLADLDAKQLAVLQDALGKLWARAERHDLHPISIRARAAEHVRAQMSLRQRRGLRTLKASRKQP